MRFTIGVLEIVAVLLISIPTLVFFFRRDQRYRWGVAALTCASLAAAITPADLLSMIVFFFAFFAMFLFGSSYRLNPPANAD